MKPNQLVAGDVLDGDSGGRFLRTKRRVDEEQPTWSELAAIAAEVNQWRRLQSFLRVTDRGCEKARERLRRGGEVAGLRRQSPDDTFPE